MRPDFRLLHGHTISGLAYLNGTRLVKTTGVLPPWNRQSWEEKERNRLQSMLNHRKHRGWGGWGGCKQGRQCLHENREVRKHNSSKQYNSFIWSEWRPIFFPGVCVRGEAAGERLAFYWCLWRRGHGSLLGFEFSTWSISGHTCGLLKPMTVELTNSILHGVNEGRADVRCPSRDTPACKCMCLRYN